MKVKCTCCGNIMEVTELYIETTLQGEIAHCPRCGASGRVDNMEE